MFPQAKLGFLIATSIVGLERFEVAVVVVMETSNTLVNLLQLALGFQENASVDKRHDNQRDVEGDDRGGDGVFHVGVELTAVAVFSAVLGAYII